MQYHSQTSKFKVMKQILFILFFALFSTASFGQIQNNVIKVMGGNRWLQGYSEKPDSQIKGDNVLYYKTLILGMKDNTVSFKIMVVSEDPKTKKEVVKSFICYPSYARYDEVSSTLSFIINDTELIILSDLIKTPED